MNNEPVAWLVQYKDRHEFRWSKPEHLFEALACEPLFTATQDQASLIAELQAKIDEMAGEIMTLENRMGKMGGYGHN
jgi:hypothetical protein